MQRRQTILISREPESALPSGFVQYASMKQQNDLKHLVDKLQTGHSDLKLKQSSDNKIAMENYEDLTRLVSIL